MSPTAAPPWFYHLPYSPWSSQAQLALDWHRVAVRPVAYVPMLKEPLLRWRARAPLVRLTIPCLVFEQPPPGQSRLLIDSVAIARYAERVGQGPPLFPAAQEAAIETWSERAQAALSAGRALSAHGTLNDPEALRAAAPEALQLIPGLSALGGRLGVRYLKQKYRFDFESIGVYHGILRATLVHLREALQGGPWLLAGRLSFADLTAAHILHFIDPPADLPLAPAMRPHFQRPALAAEFQDLLAWRDTVFAELRREHT